MAIKLEKDRYITIRDIARCLGVSWDTVKRDIKSGALKAVDVQRRDGEGGKHRAMWRIRYADAVACYGDAIDAMWW